MDDAPHERAALLAEITRMKTGFHRLQTLCVLLFIMAGLALYQNVMAQHDLIDIHGNLNIRDDVQISRAVLHAEELSSGLTLYDRDDQDRAMFVASQNGSGLTLRDVNAVQRMIFRVNEEGSEIILTDPQQRIRFRLRVDGDTSRMTFYDEDGRKTFDTEAVAEPAHLSQVALPADPALTR